MWKLATIFSPTTLIKAGPYRARLSWETHIELDGQLLEVIQKGIPLLTWVWAWFPLGPNWITSRSFRERRACLMRMGGPLQPILRWSPHQLHGSAERIKLWNRMPETDSGGSWQGTPRRMLLDQTSCGREREWQFWMMLGTVHCW